MPVTDSIWAADRAVSEADGSVRWMVTDTTTVALHVEATAFPASLRARGLSPNTEQTYASRVALFLSYRAEQRLDWRTPSSLPLSGFQRWLVTEPLPSRSHTATGPPHQPPSGRPRVRSRNTATLVMTVAAGFLRFAIANGRAAPNIADVLSQQTPHPAARRLRYGENDQFRTVNAATFRFRITEPGYEDLTSQQTTHIIDLAPLARDRFLIALLACTGIRIGEAPGPPRQDMHLLASSHTLGCTTDGPHTHVHRRSDNPNQALAKTPKPRTTPVTPDLATPYTDYRWERDAIPEAADTETAFVNLFRPPLGQAMSYPNTKGPVRPPHPHRPAHLPPAHAAPLRRHLLAARGVGPRCRPVPPRARLADVDGALPPRR